MTSYYEWSVYESTPLYDRGSLGGLEEDIRTVAAVWFECEAHESVDRFVRHLPLECVEFRPHDRYVGTTQYDISQLGRAFLLAEEGDENRVVGRSVRSNTTFPSGNTDSSFD